MSHADHTRFVYQDEPSPPGAILRVQRADIRGAVVLDGRRPSLSYRNYGTRPLTSEEMGAVRTVVDSSRPREFAPLCAVLALTTPASCIKMSHRHLGQFCESKGPTSGERWCWMGEDPASAIATSGRVIRGDSESAAWTHRPRRSNRDLLWFRVSEPTVVCPEQPSR